MTRKRMTPLERLNDPNSIIKVFAGLEIGCLVGVLIGNWVKSVVATESFLVTLAPYLLFSWVPTAIAIAAVGVILFKRAERKVS